MGLPLYDSSCRTSQVTSGQVLCALLGPTGAVGTARTLRLRQIVISNTTATAFGVGVGLATAAGATPGGGVGSPPGVRRSSAAIDTPSVAANLYTTYATQPTAPSIYPFRLWIPGSSMVVLPFADGDELVVPPASTPLPFCLWNLGTGQVSDVSLTWEE